LAAVVAAGVFAALNWLIRRANQDAIPAGGAQ
jgi:hypothetical protein